MNKEDLMPHNIEAEMAVLGAMILDRKAILSAVELIKKEDYFYYEKHRQLYKTIIQLYENNIPVDLVTLSNELKKENLLELIGGEIYLTELLDNVATTANISHYARIVVDLYTSRKLIVICQEIARNGIQQGDDIDVLLDKAETNIFSLRDNRITEGFIHIRPLLAQNFDLIEKLSEGTIDMRGIPSGFVELDAITSGFQKGNVIVVAGRPSMGKTSIALNIGVNTSVNEKKPVGIFSLEMTRDEVTMRLLCSEARVNYQNIRNGEIKKSEWPKLTRAAGVLSEAELYIDDTAGLSLSVLGARARRIKDKTNMELLVIDYLQLIEGPKMDSREREVATISRTLKKLAKELDIPIIVVSQLSRAVEKRPDKRPMLSDLRESGTIEQDADVVIFLYRDEYYHKDKEESQGIAEVNVAKYRNGPIGNTKLTFLKEYAKFENLSHDAYLIPQS